MNTRKATIITFMFLLMINTIGCQKHDSPKEEDLEKYPELKIFSPNRTTFQGEVSDLDVGIFSFYFCSSFKTPKDLFHIVDENANKDGWEIEKVGIYGRSYYKNLKRSPTQNRKDHVILEYMPDKNKYYFKWKCGI